jgi:UDP-GlcNAc:undecaprenyl-phosphate GlcNAc-1-phosphate transferase
MPVGAGLALGIVAACAGWFGTATSRAVAHRIGFVSRPNPIVPQHTSVVADLGGVGVATGVLAAVLLHGVVSVGSAPIVAPRSGQLVGAALFLALGIVDDARPFSPRAKSVTQLLAAALFVLADGGLRVSGIRPLDHVLTALVVVTVVNAVNLTDVCDGHVGGITAVSALTFSALMGPRHLLPIALAGACVGFLVLNAPPARIFLGDAGSHLAGFLLAALIVDHVNASPTVSAAVGSILAVGVFLFELVFLVWVRARKGIPWWCGSRDHFALRLQAMGLSRWATDLRAWAAAAVLGTGAWLAERRGAAPAVTILVVAVAAAGAIAVALVRRERRAADDPPGA